MRWSAVRGRRTYLRRVRRVVAVACAALLVSGCVGPSQLTSSTREPFSLPVGPVPWEVDAPAWFHEGTLHVGDRSVPLEGQVDVFVLGATGAYWMSGNTLMFTSSTGDTETVAEVGWANMVTSADGSVFATVDQSRGPRDRYGAHVMQVAVFDARTGEQLYRTPDVEPDAGDDLDALYGELMPMLHGVSRDRVFFDDATIDLDDGSIVPVSFDEDRVAVYEGHARTLFPDGYHVALRRRGARRMVVESSMDGTGRLSPDRSTLFDVSTIPAPAVAYDASTGRRRTIQAPWRHFTLVGWSDEDTFFGVAERIDARQSSDLARPRQVVSCEVSDLSCVAVSPVVATRASTGPQAPPALLVEGRSTS